MLIPNLWAYYKDRIGGKNPTKYFTPSKPLWGFTQKPRSIISLPRNNRAMPIKNHNLFVIDAPLSLPSPNAVLGHHRRQFDTAITHPHSHQGQIEIAYCHKGQGIFLIDNAVIAFEPGDVVIVPSGTPHVIQSIQGTSSDWYFNHFCAATVLSALSNLPPAVLSATEHWWHFPKKTHPVISDTTLLLTGEVVNVLPYLPGHTSTAAQGFVLALLSLVASAKATHSQGTPTPCRLQRIGPAIHYLSTHFTESLNVDALAQYCHVSTVHFRRLFQSLVGMAPRQYLFALRIEMAKAMLKQSDATITAIAHSVGFNSVSSFNRQFQTLAGESPRAFRQRGLSPATASADSEGNTQGN